MLFIILFACLFSAESDATFTTSNISEVSLYQPFQQIESQQAEIEFWKKKAEAAPNQFAFQQQLAAANETMFGLTAEIKYLKNAEALLTGLSQQAIPGKASILRALAKNYISQHRFRAALATLEKALENGHKRKATQLMLIDVYEELGWEDKQRALLAQLADRKDFNYLIRLAKWEDGQGRLDNTIGLMKEAEAIAEAGNQKARLCWIYSNLGDYYGHAGEIALSAEYYEKALKLNPADWYSTKGLAWIAYAQDRDPDRALQMLKMLDKTVDDPAIDMLRAEILAYQNKAEDATALHKSITEQVSQKAYGGMYHHYLVQQYAQNQKTMAKALELAQKEIAERAVPGAYDLLAYVRYQQGNFTEAQEISRQHIIDKTFEPGLLINQVFYFQNADLPFVESIKAELPDAQFELGPLTYEQYLHFIQS